LARPTFSKVTIVKFTNNNKIFMDTKQLIIQELEEASEPLLTEILDFVRFLKIQQIQEAQEDRQDIEDSREASIEAQEKGTISLAAFKQELGL
jgi:hypothetical protein